MNTTNRWKIYKTWFLRLLGWDGVLPVVVFLVPRLVAYLLPQFPDAMVVFALALLIVGILYRFFVGRKHIQTNHCGRKFRLAQMIALVSGIMAIALAEGVVLASSDLQPKLSAADFEALTVTYVIYILCMALALYPGFPKPKSNMNLTIKI